MNPGLHNEKFINDLRQERGISAGGDLQETYP